MTVRRVSMVVATTLLVLASAAGTGGRAQTPGDPLDATVERIVRDYLARHPEAVETIVRDYIAKNPEVVHPAVVDFIAKQRAAAAKAATPPDRAAAIKGNAAALFNSPHQVTIGNRQGSVTMVEFFDYNCGFCKRALSDMLDLIKSHPGLRFVLREFPVLGPGSKEAAEVAVAVRMQDETGARYFEFHRKLLGGRGPANRQSALAVAREVGSDMVRLERDMASDEVRLTLEESARLARALGINGTPAYVIGEQVVMGAVGLASLRAKIPTN